MRIWGYEDIIIWEYEDMRIWEDENMRYKINDFYQENNKFIGDLKGLASKENNHHKGHFMVKKMYVKNVC